MGRNKGKEPESTADLREQLEGKGNQAKTEPKKKPPILNPRSQGQHDIIDALDNGAQLVCVSGVAGTGKTYTAVHYAEMARRTSKKPHENIKKVFLMRPAIGAGGRDLGYLPGNLDEKLEPFMRPFFDILQELNIGEEDVGKQKRYEIGSIHHLRGRTLNNAIVIIDEAQNLTDEELDMVYTRLGKNARMIMCGDPDQSDLSHKASDNPYYHFMKDVENVPGVAVVQMPDVIFRNDIIARISKVRRIGKASRAEANALNRASLEQSHRGNGHLPRPAEAFGAGLGDRAPHENGSLTSRYAGVNGQHAPAEDGDEPVTMERVLQDFEFTPSENGEPTVYDTDGDAEHVDPHSNGHAGHDDHAPG